MRKLLYLVLLLVTVTCNAQQVTVHHKAYTTCFDQSLHEPVWVKWTLTPAMLPKDHLPRTNKFTEDPLIPNTKLNKDYEGSGYDQGHLSPAQDNAADQQTEIECFYFSNMEPQLPELNRVVWKSLEMWCRSEVLSKNTTLTIVCGGYNFNKTIGPDKVAVPTYCWKAILEDGKWTAYVMPNDPAVKQFPFTHYVIDISVLDKTLGFKVEDLK